MTTADKSMGFWKTAIFYGTPAGALIIGFMMTNYLMFGLHSGATSMVIGFIIMFLVLSLIFFGIKKFRDREQGGVIKFSKALMLGLAMSLCAGIAYVVIWEVFQLFIGDRFITEYTDHLIELEKAKGVSAEALQIFTDKKMALKESYANPLFRIPVTFSEIFPMGIIVSLVSALALHVPKIWARA
ncbi:MAG: DUF4199 domain-containing protein [Hellea sp.]|nr:DUF4199 domain-containing protein [Hellea sp.]